MSGPCNPTVPDRILFVLKLEMVSTELIFTVTNLNIIMYRAAFFSLV